MAKINIRESLSKRDLISDNKYDLRNTYDSLNLSNKQKARIAEALYNNKPNKYIYSLLNNKLNENMFIDEFSRYSEEYEKLDRVSTFLTAMSPNKYYYYVGNTYFDFGQDWKWTTILAETPRGDSYQALSPRQQEDILLARSDEELEEIAKQILKNSYVDKGFMQEGFSTKDYKLGDIVTWHNDRYVIIDDENEGNLLVLRPLDKFQDSDFDDINSGASFDDVHLSKYQLAKPFNVSSRKSDQKIHESKYINEDNEEIGTIEKEALKEAFDADRVKKRIAYTTEFDNGHVIHNDYFRASSAEAEEMARQKSIENPGKVFYVKYDNVMEPCSDIKWKNGQKINESKSTDLEDAVFTKNRYDDKIYYHGFMDKKDADRHYPDRLKTKTYWYSTKHGVMPGSVPRGINILDVRDIGNKSYFKTDSIISSKDLKYYDIKEDIPPMEESKRSLKKHSKLLKENAYIKTFKLGDPEFENLYKLADILTKKSPNKYIYYVGDTYFDLGQDWMWTTVLCRGNWSSYQALNPREQEEAILANSDAELEKIADSVLSDKYCPDKKRISEDAIADKIRANQDTKEMTKRAIQILKKKGAEYKDLEKEYEKIYGDKLTFDEK